MTEEQNRQDENENLAREVLSFVIKNQKKTIRCQCGQPFQVVGYICDECGEIVLAE